MSQDLPSALQGVGQETRLPLVPQKCSVWHMVPLCNANVRAPQFRADRDRLREPQLPSGLGVCLDKIGESAGQSDAIAIGA